MTRVFERLRLRLASRWCSAGAVIVANIILRIDEKFLTPQAEE